MDHPWTNYPISGYLQPVPPGDSSGNANIVSNCWSFKPRAYVNPKLVNCVFPFANVNSAAVPKKIHINPKFKCAYYQSASGQPKIETSSPHINPHFCPSKANFNISTKQVIENMPVNTPLFNEGDYTGKPISEPEKRTQDLTEKQPLTCHTSGKFQSSASTCNSTYFWSKQNASPSFANVPIPQKEFGSGGYEKTKTNKCEPLHSLHIKTSCKIVQGITSPSNNHKINKTMNCKVQSQNPYKIVNAGKSRLDNSQKSKIYCTLKKRNLSQYSKTNLVNTEKKENGLEPDKFQLATKMKVSNVNQAEYVNKITNLIRTKYIYLNKRKQLKLSNTESYKLDKRKKNVILKRSTNAKGSCDGSMSFSKGGCVLKDKPWKSMFWKVNKFKPVNALIWRKQGSLKKDLQRVGKSYPNKTVVNIGGIMYKSTINKLTRTKDKKQSLHLFNSKPLLRSSKINQVVYVRGEKFLLGEGGKTLIRQFNSDDTDGNKKCSVRRVDIGGVTYIHKSNNIFIQTKTHQARQFVNYAKQKSIALLSNLHKRSNKPCMIYQRFGICRRNSRGMCIYIHDPKNIALCKKFLKGDCTGSHCLLSHDIVKEKVATCHFFLKGNCQRENCPFLHVKVNNKAAICMDFLHGFCSLGQNCKKRHIHQCPDFDENESCNRGNKCPYPHRKITKRKDGKTYKISKFKLAENMVKKEDKKMDGKTKKRGKKKVKAKKRKMKTDKCSLQESCNDSTIECIPKRVKLDNLPLFIPLNT